MFQLYMSLFVAALFFVLTPGILLRLPSGGSKMTVAATHAVVFALVYHLTNKMVSNYFYGSEGFFTEMKPVNQGKGNPKYGTTASGNAKSPASK
jgi:hypothetical protein